MCTNLEISSEPMNILQYYHTNSSLIMTGEVVTNFRMNKDNLLTIWENSTMNANIFYDFAERKSLPFNKCLME